VATLKEEIKELSSAKEEAQSSKVKQDEQASLMQQQFEKLQAKITDLAAQLAQRESDCVTLERERSRLSVAEVRTMMKSLV